MPVCQPKSQAVTCCDLDNPVNIKPEMKTSLHDSSTTRETTAYPVNHYIANPLSNPMLMCNTPSRPPVKPSGLCFRGPRCCISDEEVEQGEKEETDQEGGSRTLHASLHQGRLKITGSMLHCLLIGAVCYCVSVLRYRFGEEIRFTPKEVPRKPHSSASIRSSSWKDD